MMKPSTAPSRAVDLHETVRSLLSQKGTVVWWTSPDATVFDAIASMSENHVGALVVLSDGHLEGIITERDYARKVILKGRQSRETRVREIMTSPVLTVTPEQNMGECMRLMTTRQIRYLPVVEAGNMAGIVSIGDIVNWIITVQGDTIRHLHNYITGSYPS